MSSQFAILLVVLIWCTTILVQIATKIDRWNRKRRCKIANDLRERIAAFCHNIQWCGWMCHMFTQGKFNEDGTWTMPTWAVERWTRQAETPYSELSEDEKESDLREADKFLELIK